MLKAKLLVVGGDAQSGEFELRLPTVVGRGHEADLTLPHPLVSRLHCEIFERDGSLVIKDLESLNGTFVNNQKIVGEEAIEPNQLLTLGNVTFRAAYEVGVFHEQTKDADPTLADDTAMKLHKRQTIPHVAQSDSVHIKATVYDDSNGSKTDTDLPSLAEIQKATSASASKNIRLSKVGARTNASTQVETIQLESKENSQPSDVEESASSSLSRKLPR